MLLGEEDRSESFSVLGEGGKERAGGQEFHNVRGQGSVSQKPRKLFGPAKPFLLNLYLKPERCLRLKVPV